MFSAREWCNSIVSPNSFRLLREEEKQGWDRMGERAWPGNQNPAYGYEKFEILKQRNKVVN